MPSLSNSQIFDLTATVLDVKLNTFLNFQSRLFSSIANHCIVCNIIFLSSGTRPTVSNIDFYCTNIGNVRAICWIRRNSLIGITWVGHHWNNLSQIDYVNSSVIFCLFIRRYSHPFHLRPIDSLCLFHPIIEDRICFTNASSSATFRSHITKCGSFIYR